MRIVFGTRGSDLALTQTRHIVDQLVRRHPHIEVELKIIKTTGDLKQEASLAAIGGLGAFTREIELALLSGDIDVAVHSLKDLPTRQPEGLCIAVVPERENPADVLVSAAGYTLDTLPHGARVGTSSLRRKAQLLAHRPDLAVVELRGNVPTRMRKALSGELDAVILAAAGLSRLGLAETPGLFSLPLARMLPAPGQGALALETRTGDDALRALLAPLHAPEIAAAVTCERAVLQAFGGGCRAPLGVYAVVHEDMLELEAFASDVDGNMTCRISQSGNLSEAAALGEAAGRHLRNELYGQHGGERIVPSPLHGRRIVITRPPHQSASLHALLEKAGAVVHSLPLIDIAAMPNAQLPEKGVAFEWLVFTSANAVRHFGACLQYAGRSLNEYQHCRIAAIGGATARAVQEHGLAVAIMPSIHVHDALIHEILANEPHPQDKRVLLPQGNLAHSEISNALSAAGMRVTTCTVYRTAPLTLDAAQIQELMEFAPECVVFFSPSAVSAWTQSTLPETLDQAGIGILHASIGPVTSHALRQAGCATILEAETQQEEALVACLEAAFTRS